MALIRPGYTLAVARFNEEQRTAPRSPTQPVCLPLVGRAGLARPPRDGQMTVQGREWGLCLHTEGQRVAVGTWGLVWAKLLGCYFLIC